MICAVLHVWFIALTPRFKLELFYIDMFNRFDTIPACDGQKDGQTDSIVCDMRSIAR